MGTEDRVDLLARACLSRLEGVLTRRLDVQLPRPSQAVTEAAACAHFPLVQDLCDVSEHQRLLVLEAYELEAAAARILVGQRAHLVLLLRPVQLFPSSFSVLRSIRKLWSPVSDVFS